MEQHRRALDHCAGVVAQVRACDLGRTTPCTAWDLAALLAHLVGQNEGFAAAVQHARQAPPSGVAVEAFAPVAWSPEAFTGSVRRVREAFAGARPGDVVQLPEVAPGRRIPMPVVVGMHLIDTLVHTWDVAQALGRPWRPPEADLVAAGLEQARRVPDGEARRRPGAAFAPAVTGAGDAWEQALARLGREPDRG